MSTLTINYFPAEISPAILRLPFIECASWEDSTSAKEGQYAKYTSWRYQPSELSGTGVRLVLLNGPDKPSSASEESFDVGRFWRIALISIEESLASHFAGLGMGIEDAHFERLAIRRVHDTTDEMIELSTGVSFRAKRPFRDDHYGFVVMLNWEVRALFRETLENDALRGIALGMPVLYKPSANAPAPLRQFRNRFVGRIRSLESNRIAVVSCRDNVSRQVAFADLRLEASPATVKKYEQVCRRNLGPSRFLRQIQQLNMTLTRENRRNVAVLRDRLEAIRDVLRQSMGASGDQLILSLSSYQQGSLVIGLSPLKVELGGIW